MYWPLSKRICGLRSATIGNDAVTKRKAARLSFQKIDVPQEPIEADLGHTLSFRTIACASKRVAVILANLRIQYLENSYTNELSAPNGTPSPGSRALVVCFCCTTTEAETPASSPFSHLVDTERVEEFTRFCAAVSSIRALPTPSCFSERFPYLSVTWNVKKKCTQTAHTIRAQSQ